jgi:hypothetical protein
VTYRYRAGVLAQLERHGIRPTPTTPPERVREYLNDLYRYELRRLRHRLLRRDFPKTAYAARVTALREQYALLGLRLATWMEPEAGRGPDGAGIM